MYAPGPNVQMAQCMTLPNSITSLIQYRTPGPSIIVLDRFYCSSQISPFISLSTERFPITLNMKFIVTYSLDLHSAISLLLSFFNC